MTRFLTASLMSFALLSPSFADPKPVPPKVPLTEVGRAARVRQIKLTLAEHQRRFLEMKAEMDALGKRVDLLIEELEAIQAAQKAAK